MKRARTTADLATLEQIASMTGRAFMEGVLAGDLTAAPIGETLGFVLHEVGEGRAVFRGIPSLSVYNPVGTVHGGWFGTLLDSCMACAVQTALPKGAGYTTLEFKVNIIRPLFEGSGPVLAIGDATHVGRRTGVAEGKIIGEADGKLYATGSTTCLIMAI
jgi:uncharacterized protein (TIGR00369 family)